MNVADTTGVLKLRRMLNTVRGLLKLPSYMTKKETKQAVMIERWLTDLCMFNAGWHAARSTPAETLKGSASSENLLPQLADFTEYVEAMARKSPPKFVGRKKGSVSSWHYEPGYQVLAALAETQPEKTLASHIRWAVQEGWLDKTISDAVHERRLGLIRKRWAEEDAKHQIQPMLPPRKT